MKLPRRRPSKAKARRERRREELSTRLGRIEGEKPERAGGSGQERSGRGPAPATKPSAKPPASRRSKDATPKNPSERERKPRKERKKLGRRIGVAASRARSASARGLHATAKRVGPALSGAGTTAATAIHRAMPRIDWLVTLVPRAILWGGRTLAAFGGTAAAAATRLSRVITPERGIAGVIAATAVCLGVSQFVTYRGVEVGQPQYVGVSGIAPAPQTDRVDAGAAHAYLLIPVAVIAVLFAVVAVRSGRWRLGRLVALAGLVGIAVSLAVDLPKGLHTGAAGIEFEGAHAILANGFYAQLAASAVLVLCGLLLSHTVRRSGAGEPRRAGPERRRRSGSGTALAGGKA